MPDGVRAQCGQHEAALLVEAQGVRVVVGGHQPQPPAARLHGRPPGGGEERRAHPKPFAERLEGNDFTGVALNVVGEQADTLAAGLGGEARQLRRAIDRPVDYDNIGPPGFDGALPHPAAVRRHE